MKKSSELKKIANRVRRMIIRMSAEKGCFIGSAFSVVDILVALYFDCVNMKKGEDFDAAERDYVILSKGHAVSALYGVFVELGLLSEKDLYTHLDVGSNIYFHPNINVKGVEVATGSLGHGIGVGAGIATAVKMEKGKNRIFVISGDGELQEGSVWEAALFAASRKLDNLYLIVDRNKIQANVRTEGLIPLEPLKEKWESFGWAVIEVDGHNYAEISKACNNGPVKKNRPSAIIAHTKRGKGVSFLEDDIDKWFLKINPEEANKANREIG